MAASRYAVLIKQNAPVELIGLLSPYKQNTSDSFLVVSLKADWAFPAVHLELEKDDDDTPLPIQIPSEFVLAIVDITIPRPSLGFV